MSIQETRMTTTVLQPGPTIPQTGFVRLWQVLEVIPVGKTCWWQGVKSGRFPQPVKLSERCTAWRAEDIRTLIKSLSEQNAKMN